MEPDFDEKEYLKDHGRVENWADLRIVFVMFVVGIVAINLIV